LYAAPHFASKPSAAFPIKTLFLRGLKWEKVKWKMRMFFVKNDLHARFNCEPGRVFAKTRRGGRMRDKKPDDCQVDDERVTFQTPFQRQ
jgi:hypothetical protein